MATHTPSPGSASSAAVTAFSTSTLTPTAVFVTPVLTTTFTPPPECTQDHLTMLENQQYFVWLNEPNPVPNTTFSECYPPQFMTSFLQMKSSTILPAFSPLVCPDNYYTVFNQTVTERPLYVACCPSNFGFHPPDTSTPGRPGYGGTCFSNILSTTITQYDNSSSSGVMLFTTSGQAYAHPIDGFAFDAGSTPAAAAATTTGGAATSSPTTAGVVIAPASSQLQGGAIAGIAVGAIAILLAVSALLLFYIRGRNLAIQRKAQFDITYGDHRRMREDWQQACDSNNEKAAAATTSRYIHPTDDGKAAEIGGGADNGHGEVVEISSNLNWVQEMPPQQLQELETKPQELDATPLPPPRNPSRVHPKRTSSISSPSDRPSSPTRPQGRKRASAYRDPLNNWPTAPTRASAQDPRTISVDTNKNLPGTPSSVLPESRYSSLAKDDRHGSKKAAARDTQPGSASKSRSSHRTVSPIEGGGRTQNPFSTSWTSSGASGPSPAQSDFRRSADNQLSPVSVSVSPSPSASALGS